MGKARRKERDVSSSSSSQEESKQYLQTAILECTAPEYKLREIVDLPFGLDYNEWLAYHTMAFFDHINLVYGTISEFCTMSGCPEMTGPGNRLYLWVDEKGKRFKLPSPQYIDYVMTFTQKTVNDESIFPTKFDKEFPSSFEVVVRKILRLQFHVLAHIYHSHFKEIVLLNLHSHVNCIFAHLMMFNDRFKLVEDKEVEILHDLAVALKLFPPVERHESIILTPITPEPITNFDSSCETENFVNDTKEDVITTQCRSISPFLSRDNFEWENSVDQVEQVSNGSRTVFPIREVPLSDTTNCLFSKGVKNYQLTKLYNRRCTSASAVLLSYSEPMLSIQTTRRSNSSSTCYQRAVTSVCELNSNQFYQPTAVSGTSRLNFN